MGVGGGGAAPCAPLADRCREHERSQRQSQSASVDRCAWSRTRHAQYGDLARRHALLRGASAQGERAGGTVDGHGQPRVPGGGALRRHVHAQAAGPEVRSCVVSMVKCDDSSDKDDNSGEYVSLSSRGLRVVKR